MILLKRLTERIPWALLKGFNGFAVIKKGERLRKATPISKQDATVAHSYLDQDGVVHHDFAVKGQTVNREYYYKFCGVSATQYASSDQKSCRQETGKSMTTHQPTRLNLRNISWPNTKYYTYNNLHILLTLHLVTFPISQNKNRSEREKIWLRGKHKRKHDSATSVDIKNWLPPVFWTTENPVE